MQQAQEALEEFTRHFQPGDERAGGGSYVIPVVFHIIHVNGAENISDAQVEDAIRVMNDDYNKLNTDWPNVQPEFLDLVADVGIEFRLATLDPDGNCTKGVTRTVSELTNVGDSQMKGLINWPRSRYLNIWVCAYADGAAGYALYPSSVDESWGAAVDGIVVQHSYVGSIGTASPGRSRTLTHEVGHWLNLRHTWGNSNEPGLGSNCSMDDGVTDTPNTVGWTSCQLSGASCGSTKDNVENFMEYSYCSKMFTNGQRTRLLAALNSSTAQRNNLWSQSNLQLTGTWTEPSLCMAAFSSDRRVICAGDSVGFLDESFHNASTWQWSFPGGEPAVSSSAAPEVVYAEPGTYPVTLVVGDGASTEQLVQQNYITVLPDSGSQLPFVEGFETGTWPSARWSVIDQQENGAFTASTQASFSGNRSLRLGNHAASEGSVDEIISTTLDLSQLAAAPVLSFRYAFSRRTAQGGNDRLYVYVSTDCGKTWSVRGLLQAAGALVTAPLHGAPFVPNGPQEWGYMEVTNITEAYFSPSFRMKFSFVSAGGNDLWIDDINLNGQMVGMDERSVDLGAAFSVIPNPSAGEAWLVGDIGAVERLEIDVLDATGRVVEHVGRVKGARGPQRIALPTSDLARGVYLVRIIADGRRGMVRFVRE